MCHARLRDRHVMASGVLGLIAGAGHFPWKDVPTAYWRVIGEFLTPEMADAGGQIGRP